MSGEVETDEAVNGAGTIETEAHSLSAFRRALWMTRMVSLMAALMSEPFFPFPLIFFFNAQFLFNAFGGLMIQCWCWLQWKKKKKGWDFFIYIYIWRWGLWVIQNEWKISVLVFTGAGRLYGGDMFECQNEIKTELQNVGLEIPAEWAWFLCKNP